MTNHTDVSSIRARYSWVIAVLLCIFAAIVSNLGTNLQKLAWTKSQSKPSETNRSRRDSADLTSIYADLENENTAASDTDSPDHGSQFNKYWFPGLLLVMVGASCDFIALGFGAQSVVAPLGSLTLVANMFFAQVLHGESLTRRDLIATTLILLGCVFAVAFASHKNEISDIGTLLSLYKTPRFAAYAAGVIALVGCGVIYTNHMESVLLVYGSRSQRYQRLFKYHRFSYSSLSGIIGAQTVLFAKSLVELVASGFAGGGFFMFYIGTYAIFAAVAVTISLQIYWLNCALARWDALYVIPVFQAQWIVFTVLGGGIFYGEFADFTTTQASGFLFGIALTVVGVYFLSESDMADNSKSPLLSTGTPLRTEATNAEQVFLDSPLLLNSGGSSSMSYTHGQTGNFEYEQLFHQPSIGIALEHFNVPAESLKLFTTQSDRQLSLLRVVGIKDPSSVGKVIVGDVIVAVNGETTLGQNTSLDTILKKINDAERPIALRFRRIDFPLNQSKTAKTGFDMETTEVLEGKTLNPLLDLLHKKRHSLLSSPRRSSPPLQGSEQEHLLRSDES